MQPFHDELIGRHLKILENLQYDSGLFAASKKDVSTGYNKAWLRDNFYECLAFEVLGDWKTVEKTYRAVLDVFKKHEYKIDQAISKKPEHAHQYIHARFHPETFDEFWEEWGNKQNDSIGCMLFKIGELEKKRPGTVLRDADDRRIAQKLVWYLSTLEYWHDPDSGMWEENQEIHASSVGACLAGLKMMRGLEGIEVPDELLANGEEALAKLLPQESETKHSDLALLSLIWPYDIVTDEQAIRILDNVENELLKERGVIRYKADLYYSKDPESPEGNEAEWTFGLSWLSIIYKMRGDDHKANYFLEEAKRTASQKNGAIPELYYADSPEHNDNTPLGWSESLFIVALHEMSGGE